MALVLTTNGAYVGYIIRRWRVRPAPGNLNTVQHTLTHCSATRYRYCTGSVSDVSRLSFRLSIQRPVTSRSEFSITTVIYYMQYIRPSAALWHIYVFSVAPMTLHVTHTQS